jgi:hypothetical protein
MRKNQKDKGKNKQLIFLFCFPELSGAVQFWDLGQWESSCSGPNARAPALWVVLLTSQMPDTPHLTCSILLLSLVCVIPHQTDFLYHVVQFPG